MLSRFLPTGSRWTGRRAPQAITGIDRSSPLADGLIVAIPWGVTGPSEIATGYPVINLDLDDAGAQPGGVPDMDVAAHLWTSSNTGEEFSLDSGGAGVLGNLQQMTFAFWGIDFTAEGNGGAIWSERPSATPIWKVVGPGDTAIGSTEVGVVGRGTGGLHRLGTTGDLLQDGLLHNVTFTRDVFNLDFYIDGALNNAHTTFNPGVITADDPIIGWDDVDTASNSRLLFPVPLMLAWDRVLSDGEIAEHYENPWGVFYVHTPRAHFLPAAAGGGATIAAKAHHHRMMLSA